jgi:hypothetical protein
MQSCCPPGRGCNAPHDEEPEPCALLLCRSAVSEGGYASLALERWRELQKARRQHRSDGERRFRRRAFERARDRALIALAMNRAA